MNDTKRRGRQWTEKLVMSGTTVMSSLNFEGNQISLGTTLGRTEARIRKGKKITENHSSLGFDIER
jgi:hypothetical protein